MMKKDNCLISKIIFLFVAIVVFISLIILTASAAGLSNEKVINLTDEEKAYIANNPRVSIAMDISWIPYALYDKDKQSVEGTIPNVLDKVAGRVGLKVDYITKNTYLEALTAVRDGETMLVSGIANDSAMAQKNRILRTAPYLKVNYSAITKEEISDLYDEESARKVAVCVGSYSTVAMKEKMPSYKFIEYRSNEECIQAVLNDEVDMALVAVYAADYYMGLHQYTGLYSVLISEFSWSLCFGVNKDADPMLIQILNKGIASLTENDVNQAFYSSLIDAANRNRSFMDWVYNRPLLAVGLVATVVTLFLLIAFMFIMQHHKIRELERERVLIQDRDEKEALLNAIPEGVGIFEIKDGIAYVQYINDSYYQLVEDTRSNREEFFEHGMEPEDRPMVQKAVKELLEGKDRTAFNYRAIKGTGGYVWIRIVACVALRNKEGMIVYCSFTGIDDVVEAQLALEQNSEILKAAIKSANMRVWEFDCQKNRIVQTEGALCAQGFSPVIENAPESLIETGYVHANCADACRRLFQSIFLEKQSVQGDLLVKDAASGGDCWKRVILTPVFGTDGTLKKAIGASININERKGKEAKYLRQLDSMSEANDANLIMKGRYNLTRNVILYYGVKVNNAFKFSEGKYDDVVEKLAGDTVTEGYCEKIRSKMERHKLLQDFANGKNEGKLEYKKYALAGNAVWVELKYTLFEEPNTNDIVVFVYGYDITERVIDREIVSKLSNMEYDALGLLDVRTRLVLRSVLSKIEGPIVIGNGDFDERANTRLSAILVPSEKEAVIELFQTDNIIEHLKESQFYYFTYSIIDNDEKIRRKKMQFCYLDDTQTAILYCRSDITDMYQKEQEQLQRTEKALEAAKKANHAKTDFFSRMSHDMRTPMNGILGLAELSKDETDSEILRQNISKIKTSGEYLLGLINDTLDFQRIESGKMKLDLQIVDAAALVDNTIEMMRIAAKEKGVILNIVNENTELGWNIRTDSMRIKQIFINLLSNAIKFTPRGGTVDFIFKCLGREGMISHDLVIVRDTGIGMSKEFLKNGIFKPFSQEYNRVTSEYAGSGLGLSIAKNLIELMHGRIEVESELGVGTKFKVYIDFERVDRSDAVKSVGDDQLHKKAMRDALSGKHILLVEDHPLNAEITKKLLDKVGCKVVWAKDGKEGYNFFISAPEFHYAAILMDIRMPVMDGLKSAKAIRCSEKADAGSIPIIAMTANAYEEDVKKSRAAGMNAHIAKPIDSIKLYETLVQHIVGLGLG